MSAWLHTPCAQRHADLELSVICGIAICRCNTSSWRRQVSSNASCPSQLHEWYLPDRRGCAAAVRIHRVLCLAAHMHMFNRLATICWLRHMALLASTTCVLKLGSRPRLHTWLPAGFDSHFSSCGKEYHYLLGCGAPNPLHARQRWWVCDRWCDQSRGKPQRLSDIRLDVEAMREAAQLLQVGLS